MEIKPVKPGRPDSYEGLMHQTSLPRFLLDFSAATPARSALQAERLDRFIGVIYRPESELASHYARAVLARQFDAFIWFDRTRAVAALADDHGSGMPETYPFGL
jgi:erythromycin esterase-like protein